MYAKEDIHSYNRSLYAKQNDFLAPIRSDGLVAIVETAHGNRFPCLVELLSEDEVVVLVETPEVVRKEQLELW
jgi:type II secretory pathway component GspD/PulD (secretin)